jgi:hypothetical protein
MRFEVGAAYTMGFGLPLLEALRRKTNLDNFHSYADMTVVVIKGVLYAIALTGLVLASRSAIGKQGAG